MSLAAQLPPDMVVTATIYHIPTTAGVKDFPGSADATIVAGILPMSTHKRALLGGDLSLTHIMFLGEYDDVREGDKVIITAGGRAIDDNTEFRVSHIDKHGYGGHPHRQAILSKIE